MSSLRRGKNAQMRKRIFLTANHKGLGKIQICKVSWRMDRILVNEFGKKKMLAYRELWVSEWTKWQKIKVSSGATVVGAQDVCWGGMRRKCRYLCFCGSGLSITIHDFDVVKKQWLYLLSIYFLRKIVA